MEYNSLIEDIVNDMRIFTHKQEEGIVYSSNNSIYRKLSVIPDQCPHVAVARVIYESEGHFLAYPIQAIFSSTIQHGVKDGVKERFDTRYQSAMKDLLYGIYPYYGSPCRFAHSERAVGVYLLGELSKILKDKDLSFVLIQIKTSLAPCPDCRAFWSGSVSIGKDKDTDSYLDFGVKEDDPMVTKIDWLELLRNILEKDLSFKGNIAVSINCSVKINDDREVRSSQPVERII